MNAPLVRVEHLSKTYREGGVDTTVLQDVDFALGHGETVSLLGTSGAGKSTLMALLAGLLLPDSGALWFDGEDVAGMDEASRAALRARRIGVVLQSDNLIPFLTARENVELAIELADGGRDTGRAEELLSELGLEERLNDLPRRLSGGESQRASLAVALANRPRLLLADEVTAELDSKSAARVLDVMLGAASEQGLTVLMVTHSAELAARTERRLRVVGGAVVEA